MKKYFNTKIWHITQSLDPGRNFDHKTQVLVISKYRIFKNPLLVHEFRAPIASLNLSRATHKKYKSQTDDNDCESEDQTFRISGRYLVCDIVHCHEDISLVWLRSPLIPSRPFVVRLVWTRREIKGN